MMRKVFRLGGPRRIGRDVDEEVAFHLEMRTRKLLAAGLDSDRARVEALRRFGDVDTVRHDCIVHDRERERAMRRRSILGGLGHDAAFAVRTMRRNPRVALGVAGMLALGIGANAAIFTLINALLFRPLPVQEPNRLVAIGAPWRVTSVSQGDDLRADLYSYPLYRDVQGHGGAFRDVLATGRVDRLDVSVDSTIGVEYPRARFVSANYFQVLGVPAVIGRGFDGKEDRDGTPAIVVSHGWWTRRFQRDPTVVGKGITINGVGVTIIGVTPAGFTGAVVGMAPDFWMPIGLRPLILPHESWLEDRQTSWLVLLGRLAPGATLEQARADLVPFVRGRLQEHTTLPAGAAAEQARAADVPMSPGGRGLSRARMSYRVPLLTLLSGVGILLFIICANVANLMLARAVARTREVGVRMAIGAGRLRLVRQLLTESLLLGLVGVAGGLLVAWWGSRLLLRVAADGGSVIPLDTTLDVRVLGFTGAVALVAVLLSGLTPALRASRVDVVSALKAGGGTLGGLGARGQRMPLGRLLIAGQLALSLVLLIGAALFVRNLTTLQRADGGVDRDRLLIVDVDAIGRGYLDERLGRMAEDLAARFRRLPGVASVTYSENGIFSGTESALTLRVPGFTPTSASDSAANYDQIGPAYFATVGGRLLRGREFTDRDGAGRSPVILINETMARFYFGPADPVGQTVYFDDTTTATVVGVTSDVAYHSLEAPPARRFYLPLLQRQLGSATALRFELRTTGEPARLTGAVREAVADVDPRLPITGIDPLTELMRRSLREQRLVTKLAGGFGILSLVLAAVGLYGVMSYAMTRRTGEFGLRMALGAGRHDILRLVLGDAAVVVTVGIVVGVPLALAAGRILRSQLAGVSVADPAAFVTSLAVLAISAAAAAIVPALRAARVNPVVALRAE